MAARESIYQDLKFLFIDDFPAMCKQIERILLGTGAQHVDIVYDGEKALLNCSREKYDVIFADFNLGAGKNTPQMQVYDILAEIAAEAGDTQAQ